MTDAASVGRWGRVAAQIAFAQAALSFAFFVFLGIYAERVNHSFEQRSITVYLSALAFMLGVPAAFVAAGLAFRSAVRSLIWLGVTLEGVGSVLGLGHGQPGARP